jgi:hypothetical protein
MDEAGARALLERVGATPAPPSGVDIGLARERGRRRLRRRRLGTALAPVLAAAAVTGIILGTGALAGGTGTGPGAGKGHPGPVSPVPSRPPQRFDPLRLYATFGWLPPGVSHGAEIARSLPTEQISLSGSPRTGQYQITDWASGMCNRDAAQLARALRRHRQPLLRCGPGPSEGWPMEVRSQAPPVHGRPGFWLDGGTLAWQYAPRSWAYLDTNRRGRAVPPAVMLRVASAIRYGVPAPAPRFPYQLTGLPASWRVTNARWKTSSLPGSQLWAGLIEQVQVMPGRVRCWFDPTASRRITLTGAKAVLTVYRQPGVPSYQGLCVRETDGLSVNFLLFRAPHSHTYPLGGAARVFLHHLHLLGPDPAKWTTSPLG